MFTRLVANARGTGGPRYYWKSTLSNLRTWRHSFNQIPKNKKIRWSAYAALGTTVFWYGYTYNERYQLGYNREIQNLIKEAIWQESDRDDFNYAASLKSYVEALVKLAEDKSIDTTSDKYTRIELKVAEMLENLEMFERAQSIYSEMLTRFFIKLTSYPSKLSVDQRCDLIKKDLRILVKSLEFNHDLEKGKNLLLAHLLVAQEMILLRSPELKEYFDIKQERASKILKGQHMNINEFRTFVNNENILVSNEGYMLLDLNKDSSGWEPFKEEFFIARDLYTAYCLSSKDITTALSCKMTTVEWMVMADMPPSQIIMSQANLGSLFYLQAEKLDNDIARINIKLDKEPDLSKDSKVIQALQILNRNRQNCLTMSEKCYNSIIDFINKNPKLKYHLHDQIDNSLMQALALSNYGKGILTLDSGANLQAERLLTNSVRWAKDSDFTELLVEAENELQRVKELIASEQEMQKEELMEQV